MGVRAPLTIAMSLMFMCSVLFESVARNRWGLNFPKLRLGDADGAIRRPVRAESRVCFKHSSLAAASVQWPVFGGCTDARQNQNADLSTSLGMTSAFSRTETWRAASLRADYRLGP